MMIYVDFQRQSLDYLTLFVDYFQSGGISVCLDAARDFQCTPYRARFHSWYSVCLVLIDHVCYEPCLKTCRVIAACLVIVCDDIVDKTSIACLNTCSRTIFLPFAHTYGHHALVALAEEDSLDIGAFALPCTN